MGLSIEQFVQKYFNKICTHPRGIAGQCVCLYRCYLDQVLGVPQSPGVTGARMIWNTYLVDYFERIPKGAFIAPMKGDIVIFDRFPGNVYGHVGMANKNASLFSRTFTSFDSNWSVPRKARIEIHDYRYVLGWLRRRGTVGVSDQQIQDLYRTIWMREPAYGDWFYFRRRIEMGTIENTMLDLEKKVRFTYGEFLENGDDWWQKEKKKVLGVSEDGAGK